MNWQRVTKRYEKHGGGYETKVCWVNLDLVAAIEPIGNGSRLIWHASSPRTTWDIDEPFSWFELT